MEKEIYDFTHIWNLKKTNTIKQKNRYRKQISGQQRGRLTANWISWGEGKMVMDGNQTCGGDLFVAYTDVEL